MAWLDDILGACRRVSDDVIGTGIRSVANATQFKADCECRP